jgi:hypothetical protein
VAVLGPVGEDTGAAMWQFWGRGVRIRGLLCGSFGAGYGGCCVAVLGPEGEDTDEDTGVAMCDARIMLAPWRWEVCGQGASCLLIGDSYGPKPYKFIWPGHI